MWRALTLMAALLAILLVGCSAGQARPTATSTSAPQTLILPSILQGQHVFVTDLVTGDLAELGGATTHVSRSVHGLGLSPDGHWLYVSDVAGNRLIAYALKDGALGESHVVPVGAQPVHMVETLDGRRVFVTNFAGKSVSVVNTATWTLEKTIATPNAPHSIVLSPDGRWAYAGCYGAASVVVIDTASATLAGAIALPVGAQPYGLALSKDGRTLYASDNSTGRLFVIDVASAPTGKVTGSVEVGLRPALIARSPDANTLYISSGASHSVTVVSLAPDPSASHRTRDHPGQRLSTWPRRDARWQIRRRGEHHRQDALRYRDQLEHGCGDDTGRAIPKRRAHPSLTDITMRAVYCRQMSFVAPGRTSSPDPLSRRRGGTIGDRRRHESPLPFRGGAGGRGQLLPPEGEPAMSDQSLATYYAGWDRYQDLLVAAVAPLTPEQLALRAAPHQREVWVIAAHIITARVGWFHSIMGEGDPGLAHYADLE